LKLFEKEPEKHHSIALNLNQMPILLLKYLEKFLEPVYLNNLPDLQHQK
jgi:hypothetical protein